MAEKIRSNAHIGDVTAGAVDSVRRWLSGEEPKPGEATPQEEATGITPESSWLPIARAEKGIKEIVGEEYDPRILDTSTRPVRDGRKTKQLGALLLSTLLD